VEIRLVSTVLGPLQHIDNELKFAYNLRNWNSCLVFYPVQDWTGAEGFQEVETIRFPQNRVARPTQGPPLSQGNTSNTNFCYRMIRPQCYSAAGNIKSMKNPNELIWNRTCDLPACSAVPQPTAPPRVPPLFITNINGSVFTYCLILWLRVFPKFCRLYYILPTWKRNDSFLPRPFQSITCTLP